ncbi:hypothetical protein RIF29_39290 [Crotalaria pallida]|uniref:Uncharacterized protein n=1 Tax=Crotalaria pallida TaxID=3830 RepID=A0AAN9E0Z4_CROPI
MVGNPRSLLPHSISLPSLSQHAFSLSSLARPRLHHGSATAVPPSPYALSQSRFRRRHLHGRSSCPPPRFPLPIRDPQGASPPSNNRATTKPPSPSRVRIQLGQGSAAQVTSTMLKNEGVAAFYKEGISFR